MGDARMRAYRHRIGRGDQEDIWVELTRRNLEILLAKLGDPKSARTIFKGTDDGNGLTYVRAVENEEHYGVLAGDDQPIDRPGEMLINGVMR